MIPGFKVTRIWLFNTMAMEKKTRPNNLYIITNECQEEKHDGIKRSRSRFNHGVGRTFCCNSIDKYNYNN